MPSRGAVVGGTGPGLNLRAKMRGFSVDSALLGDEETKALFDSTVFAGQWRWRTVGDSEAHLTF